MEATKPIDTPAPSQLSSSSSGDDMPYDELARAVRKATTKTGFNYYVIASPPTPRAARGKRDSVCVTFRGAGTVIPGHELLSKALVEAGMDPEGASVADAAQGGGVVLFTALPLPDALAAIDP
eukprot:m51a1_g5568 hypothetical protein (123) ;mRNA; f:598960-599328